MAAIPKSQLIDRIQQAGLIAVIRAESADAAVQVCRALHAGGVSVLEIAMTTPDCLKAIEVAAAEFGSSCLVGVGTVLDPETARHAVRAGASFVFAPNTNPAVIEAVKQLDKPMVPGALTPTEVAAALAAGADVIKLFPANVFGPSYIKDLQGPYPGIKITPTGGVELSNMADWFKAGAIAVGVGSNLVRKDLIKAGKWDDLTALARQYAQAVQSARPAR
jgi:2-dehydro-3-deoxyphosphogluconate aldolase/(4S)-4-hydroxy-2-oxoglutarate aldolase